MSFEIITLVAVAAAAIAASVHTVARDGYRRIPTRRF